MPVCQASGFLQEGWHRSQQELLLPLPPPARPTQEWSPQSGTDGQNRMESSRVGSKGLIPPQSSEMRELPRDERWLLATGC